MAYDVAGDYVYRLLSSLLCVLQAERDRGDHEVNPVFKKALKEQYPTVFTKVNPCTGDGWFLIVWNLCKVLEPLGIRAYDMKEKYGELCFRVDSQNPIVRRAIRHAETMSYETCENCGDPGVMNDEGWHKVLCKKCPEVNYE